MQPKRRFTASNFCGQAIRPDGAKRPTHEVHEVLNDLHGLTVRARNMH
jgi:hypothetical protein